MRYPPDIPEASRRAIERAEIRADISFTRAKQGLWELSAPFHPWDPRGCISYSPVEALAVERVLRIFAAFAHEACKLGRAGQWAVTRVRDEVDSCLRTLCSETQDMCLHNEGWTVVRLLQGDAPRHEVRLQIERSTEWRKYQRELLRLAESQSVRDVRSGQAAQVPTIHLVSAFIDKCLQETGVKVQKTHIWKAAGHKTGRQFQYWQKGDERATERDDANFRRVLAMKPKDFIEVLHKKKLLPPESQA